MLRLNQKASNQMFKRFLATNKTYGKTFDKILIANRGEIACRVIKTAKKMGIKTVAIYSEADSNALHVAMADEAVCVGPAATSLSYLNIPNILSAIKQTGAQAVHPGYGFLSENSVFVEELDKAKVAFIGPAESSMAKMGDKIQSKIIAKNAGVNTIPGYNGVVKDVKHAIEIANEVGYPVMIKASAGGGGKGMRIAYSDKECDEAFRLSSAEFWLPERECSIQRRNQKVIEEAPSPFIDAETRRKMGEQAVALAKNVGYYSAGTCEFLVDKNKDFYFLEMNTRLQVEHPITEYITNLDLVELMIRVAAGQTLSLKQDEVKTPKGWAFESRVYAEDPEKYLPSIGRLSKYEEPKGEGVRCDSGIVEGSEISVYYDPMICKLVTGGENREVALHRMENALDDYVIKGVTHNIPLLRDVISSERFKQGRLTTKFLAEEYPKGFKGRKLSVSDEENLFAVLASVWGRREFNKKTWKAGGGSLTTPGGSTSTIVDQRSEIFMQIGERESVKVVLIKEKDTYRVEIGGKTLSVKSDWLMESALIKATVKDSATGKENSVTAQYLDVLPLGFRVSYFGSKFDISIKTPLQQKLSKHMIPKVKLDLTKFVVSPMPGTVISISVKEGETVAEGTEVAIVEAMKMQNVLRAPREEVIKFSSSSV
ncbi:hypothetical protein HK099_004431 [Clydaea vesicula]|uniref:Propionyl-CoA carboxylase alpha chain, mitochondrial n=1 Tax=Clydaea vesicula TaxID=447962 RepID=A0AAD5XZM2_9FUNG|nr:hypothetical protein HK099_004431 [Clydaea vesicula]